MVPSERGRGYRLSPDEVSELHRRIRAREAPWKIRLDFGISKNTWIHHRKAVEAQARAEAERLAAPQIAVHAAEVVEYLAKGWTLPPTPQPKPLEDLGLVILNRPEAKL